MVDVLKQWEAAPRGARILALQDRGVYYVTPMSIRRVGAREANQQFSSLLAAAERDGDTIVIMRRGRAVARLIPEPAVNDSDTGAWLTELVDRFSRHRKGENCTRAELHERGDR